MTGPSQRRHPASPRHPANPRCRGGARWSTSARASRGLRRGLEAPHAAAPAVAASASKPTSSPAVARDGTPSPGCAASGARTTCSGGATAAVGVGAVAWPLPNRDSHSAARSMLRKRAVANTGLEQCARAARRAEERAQRCGKRLTNRTTESDSGRPPGSRTPVEGGEHRQTVFFRNIARARSVRAPAPARPRARTRNNVPKPCASASALRRAVERAGGADSSSPFSNAASARACSNTRRTRPPRAPPPQQQVADVRGRRRAVQTAAWGQRADGPRANANAAGGRVGEPRGRGCASAAAGDARRPPTSASAEQLSLLACCRRLLRAILFVRSAGGQERRQRREN
jgi:hypothetical protein